MIRHYDVASGESISESTEERVAHGPLAATQEGLMTLHEAIALETTRGRRMPADILHLDVGDFVARQGRFV